MKNVNLKKLIIPNIPYVLFIYLFDTALTTAAALSCGKMTAFLKNEK